LLSSFCESSWISSYGAAGAVKLGGLPSALWPKLYPVRGAEEECGECGAAAAAPNPADLLLVIKSRAADPIRLEGKSRGRVPLPATNA
jgi:hypothetical protein